MSCMRSFPALIFVFAALALGACGSDSNEGDGAEAQAGGVQGRTLTIYSGREKELIDPLLKRYERDSGRKVEVRYGDSAELAATILEEGDNTPADVFFSQDAGALGALQKAGKLSKLPAAALDPVPERFRSAEGRWTGISGRARIVAYDTRELEASDLPRSILDFTDERWKGKIGWAPTNASFQSFVTALRKTRGEEAARAWVEGIRANDAQAFEKNSAVRDAIAAGEIQVGFINHYYVAEARAEEGEDYPVGIYEPPGGDPGALVNVAGAGVLAGSGSPEAAAAFVRYMLAPGAQRYFAEETKEYPLVDGVKADAGLQPLESIEQPDVDLSDLDDLQGTLRLLEQANAL